MLLRAKKLAREMSSFRNYFVSALMRSLPLFKYPKISGICEQYMISVTVENFSAVTSEELSIYQKDFNESR